MLEVDESDMSARAAFDPQTLALMQFAHDRACKLLDTKSCQCTRYKDRSKLVKDCIRLTPQNVKKIRWLPDTCAYRLVADGKDLFDWHYLKCGDRNAVHRAGISGRGRIISEQDAGELEDHLVDWVSPQPRKRSTKR